MPRPKYRDRNKAKQDRLYRYYAQQDKKKKRDQEAGEWLLVAQIMVCLTIIGAVILGIVYALEANMEKASKLLYIIFAIPLAILFYVLADVVLGLFGLWWVAFIIGPWIVISVGRRAQVFKGWRQPKQ